MLQRFKPEVHVDRRNTLTPILLGPEDQVLLNLQLVNGLSSNISGFIFDELPIDVESNTKKFGNDLSDIFTNFFKLHFDNIFEFFSAFL